MRPPRAHRHGAAGTARRLRGAAAAWALAILSGAAPVAANAATCGDRLPAGPRQVARTGDWTVAFQPRPAPWVSGKPLLLELEVCGPAGAAMPARVAVDADMPAHKHGMNYRPTVRALAPGRYQAEGLLLHMAGRWRILIDLQPAQGAALRIEAPIDVP